MRFQVVINTEVLSRFRSPLPMFMGQLAMTLAPRLPSRCRWKMTMMLS